MVTNKSYLTYILMTRYFGTKQANYNQDEIVNHIIDKIIQEVNDEDVDEKDQYSLLKELIFFAVDLDALEDHLKGY
ncbi:MAG: hypothetical protein Unbinned8454contig1000_19 [Prokaryotic dsDNA virus sp.]|nr:MAG: hypothetical protein Unbinned8454contig1000_19 [Prokaryotic dsDNA virus sp.]|tara:strand:+ start:10529 stop:10756 length:228 start_codon:yes stop_codon:yes gene_type:complete